MADWRWRLLHLAGPGGYPGFLTGTWLERDPLGQVERMYDALNLPDFLSAKDGLEEYSQATAGYRKNEFPDLDSRLKRRIADHWQPSFDQWSYPTGLST